VFLNLKLLIWSKKIYNWFLGYIFANSFRYFLNRIYGFFCPQKITWGSEISTPAGVYKGRLGSGEQMNIWLVSLFAYCRTRGIWILWWRNLTECARVHTVLPDWNTEFGTIISFSTKWIQIFTVFQLKNKRPYMSKYMKWHG